MTSNFWTAMSAGRLAWCERVHRPNSKPPNLIHSLGPYPKPFILTPTARPRRSLPPSNLHQADTHDPLARLPLTLLPPALLPRSSPSHIPPPLTSLLPLSCPCHARACLSGFITSAWPPIFANTACCVLAAAAMAVPSHALLWSSAMGIGLGVASSFPAVGPRTVY